MDLNGTIHKNLENSSVFRVEISSTTSVHLKYCETESDNCPMDIQLVYLIIGTVSSGLIILVISAIVGVFWDVCYKTF
jgi:hypothetical protein